MEVQPSLVLLQKTLLNIEGLGKQLYPDLDLWDNALPFLENWQRERLSPIANLKKISEKIPEWLEQLPEIPELIYESMQELKYARLHRERLQQDQEAHMAKAEAARARRYTIFGIAALAAAAVSLLPGVAGSLDRLPAATLILATAGLALLVLRR